MIYQVVAIMRIALDLGFIVSCIINVRTFYKISAVKNNVKYYNFFVQWAFINARNKGELEAIDLLPISLFLKLFGRDDKKWGIKAMALYRFKYKVEMFFWGSLVFNGILQIVIRFYNL